MRTGVMSVPLNWSPSMAYGGNFSVIDCDAQFSTGAHAIAELNPLMASGKTVCFNGTASITLDGTLSMPFDGGPPSFKGAGLIGSAFTRT
ncbi:MAG: hypothetical protein ABJA93_06180, partial [Sporichthyaceae bacterium]